MIKNFATLLIFGLAYSNHATAQELHAGDIDALERIDLINESSADMAEGDQGNPLYPSFSPWDRDMQPNIRSFGRPLVVLPLPPLINRMPGFHFPGSYMPRWTPLHRFNGYIVCNPPNLNRETAVETTAGAPAQRLAKITSTRSPSTPGYPGPCPIYTINGELPQQKSHGTTILPSTGNALTRQGEHR